MARSRAGWWALAILTLVPLTVAMALAGERHLMSFGPAGMAVGRADRLTSLAYLARHGLELLWILGLMGWPLFLALALLAWLMASRPWRRLAIAVVVAPLLLVLLDAPVQLAAPALRQRALPSATELLRPLVAAVERYELEHGVPPESLAVLEHETGLGVDTFGLRGCRPLTYRRAWNAGWQLEMECPNGFMQLDRLLYAPGNRQADPRLDGWQYLRD